MVLLQLKGSYFVLAGYVHRYMVGTDAPALFGQSWVIHAVDEAPYRDWHAMQLVEGRRKRLTRAP